ncbi:MAG: S9 family peptidase [Calditrichaeota bacterium]|nr:S9 family peptidase [Calditrichota bacterium]
MYLLIIILVQMQSAIQPSFEDLISLEVPDNAIISPNGEFTVYRKQTADWENDTFYRELYLSTKESEFKRITFTNTSLYEIKWSPDNRWISYFRSDNGNNQIYLFDMKTMKELPLTGIETSVIAFDWSPDSHSIAFITQNVDENSGPESGSYGIYSYNVQERLKNPDLKMSGIITQNTYSVEQFKWSNNGSKIAFISNPSSDIANELLIYDLNSRNFSPLVAKTGAHRIIDWSPDDMYLAIQSTLGDTLGALKTPHYLKVNIKTAAMSRLVNRFDYILDDMVWCGDDIFALAEMRTKRNLLKINPENQSYEIIKSDLNRIYSFSINSNYKMALIGTEADRLREVYIGKIGRFKKVTGFTQKAADWMVPQSELINWKSKDGVEIEGILYKPKRYDPSKKYPLFVVVHGGPMLSDFPDLLPDFNQFSRRISPYPTVHFINKGALLLKLNYRGSLGYGEQFRSLSVDNIGFGEAWDVESGIDKLINDGLVDPNKIALMGWSWGGFVSAFLMTQTTRFQAISVGAGIIDWLNFYRDKHLYGSMSYISESPWMNLAPYIKFSPVNYVRNAKTPTLIQHGDRDFIVPVSNAYELNNALNALDVEHKLIIYKNEGHGIGKPKGRLASLWHNWIWFNKYIWNEDIEEPALLNE